MTKPNYSVNPVNLKTKTVPNDTVIVDGNNVKQDYQIQDVNLALTKLPLPVNMTLGDKTVPVEGIVIHTAKLNELNGSHLSSGH